MKKIAVFLFSIIFLISCTTKEENVSFSDEDIENINEIVEAIIIQDSVKVIDSKDESKAFCIELKKITIEIPIKLDNGLTPPPASGSISLFNLLDDKVNGEIFFPKKDSSKIMSQNLRPEKFKIGQKLSQKLNLTTFEHEILKKENGVRYAFYEMSIPIFSNDKMKAYVELDYFCGSLCGHGKGFYLKKVDSKWTIIAEFGTWIS